MWGMESVITYWEQKNCLLRNDQTGTVMSNPAFYSADRTEGWPFRCMQWWLCAWLIQCYSTRGLLQYCQSSGQKFQPYLGWYLEFFSPRGVSESVSMPRMFAEPSSVNTLRWTLWHVWHWVIQASRSVSPVQLLHSCRCFLRIGSVIVYSPMWPS
jgi:hypothetical protein